MTTRRRLCRAAACPRHVDRSVVFCDVHWNQLRPIDQAQVVGNREAPTGASLTQQRASLSAIDQCVTLLAKKEGRARSLKIAKQTASFEPGQGGAGGSGGATAPQPAPVPPPLTVGEDGTVTVAPLPAPPSGSSSGGTASGGGGGGSGKPRLNKF